MINTDNYIYAIKMAVKYASVSLDWYTKTKDEYHLKTGLDWVDVASIYMREIKNTETCVDQNEYY